MCANATARENSRKTTCMAHMHDIWVAVSQYKGVAYARNFPDAQRIYRSISPFGDLQVYQSSYMHFAPGLSDRRNMTFCIRSGPRSSSSIVVIASSASICGSRINCSMS